MVEFPGEVYTVYSMFWPYYEPLFVVSRTSYPCPILRNNDVHRELDPQVAPQPPTSPKAAAAAEAEAVPVPHSHASTNGSARNTRKQRKKKKKQSETREL